MIIGKVVGTVICTRKNSSLVGSKFLIVDPMEKMEIDGCDRIVAVDDVGAGIGELVLVATGSAARLGCGSHSAQFRMIVSARSSNLAYVGKPAPPAPTIPFCCNMLLNSFISIISLLQS